MGPLEDAEVEGALVGLLTEVWALPSFAGKEEGPALELTPRVVCV